MDSIALVFAGIVAQLGISYLQASLLYVHGQKAWAEWLAWGIIALFYRVRPYLRKGATNNKDEPLLDKEAQPSQNETSPRFERASLILAVFLVACQFITLHIHDDSLQWSLPLTTLLTFLIANFAKQFGSDRALDNDLLQSWHERIPSSVRPNSEHGLPIAAFAGVSLVSCIVLFPPSSELTRIGLSSGFLYMLLMTVVYTLLTKVMASIHRENAPMGPLSLIEPLMQPTALRAFAGWTLCLAIFSPTAPRFSLLVLGLGILRIVQILSIFLLCHGNSGVPASTLATVAAAIVDSLRSTDQGVTFLYTLVTIGTLLQTCSSVAKSSISRTWIFVLLLLPCLSLLNVPAIRRHGPPTQPVADTIVRPGPVHPIQRLVQDGNDQFNAMLARQSKTAEEGAVEYQRRYGRPPPRGYDRWFQIAQSKGFEFIDEFDSIMQSLEPFWGIPASSVRARLKAIEEAPFLIDFKITKDKFVYNSDHYHAAELAKWVKYDTWGDILPEVSFYISTLDEPRVVAPYDTVDLAMERAAEQRATQVSRDFAQSAEISNRVRWINVAQQNVWEAMLSSCPVDSPARKEMVAPDLTDLGISLPFVGNMTANKDVCASPDQLHGHGFLAAPDSLTITHSLVPIFCQCKPSIFNDVLYPSPYYQSQIDSEDYNEAEDPPWAEKLNRMYWAGAATGGHTKGDSWMDMHRQRVTMMTSPDSTMLVHLLQQDKSGLWQPHQRTWASLSNLFHMRITSVVQCEADACEAMKARFGINEPEPKSAALQSKYALDIDGNTFSGRYYRLLKSKVCVFKHTAFNEWHDGRLVPWVHFVPVSTGAEELGELVRYLTQEEDGLKIGERIAEQGKDWARKTLRSEDLEIVFVRVMLEYARVLRDDRDLWNVI